MVFSILISQPIIYSTSTCLPCISESTDQLSIWECLIGVCVEFVSTWTYMWARWAVNLSIVLRTSRTLSFWVVRMRRFSVWVAWVIHLKYITRGWLLEEVLYSMKTSIAFLISTVHEKMIISDNLQSKEIRLSVLGHTILNVLLRNWNTFPHKIRENEQDLREASIYFLCF